MLKREFPVEDTNMSNLNIPKEYNVNFAYKVKREFTEIAYILNRCFLRLM